MSSEADHSTNINRHILKRGPAEGLPMSNGSLATNPQNMEGLNPDSDAKKAKLDEVALLSQDSIEIDLNVIGRIVHLRNLPIDCTDAELYDHFRDFGKLERVFVMKSKNQGFLEFENGEDALKLINQSATSPIQIRGKAVACQYSNHQMLVSGEPLFARAAGHEPDARSFSMSPVDNVPISNVITCLEGSTSRPVDGTTGTGHAGMQIRTVLRVIVENLIFPITLDSLYQIFSRFGVVLRIVTFRKNQSYQALIQFADSASAQCAKMILDGKPLFSGYSTIRVEYSRMSTLNVKYNNEKSRDFTNPSLPSGELPAESPSIDFASLLNASTALSQLHGGLTSSFAVGAPYATGFSPAAALQVAGSPFPATTLNLPALSLATATNTALAGMASLRLPHQFSPIGVTPVVLVSNLNEEKVTPDALFTLFGVYGDVQRVKILFNKKNSALVQYTEPTQAQLALHHLDKVTLWNRLIRVSYSKHMCVQMPKEGQPDAGLTKDYSMSLLHRFKKPGSKNYLNIYPPSSSLHLSNIPTSTTEEFLVNAFLSKGFRVRSFKFFPRDHKMAIVQLESVEQAIESLVEMHNLQLSENAHLRVSFSKPGT